MSRQVGKDLEKIFKLKLKKKILENFPTCKIINTDPTEDQAIPDLLILYGTTWAMLEVKRSSKATFRPNQKYYVEFYDTLSFADVIYPENENEVLERLYAWFRFVDLFCIKRNNLILEGKRDEQ